MSQVMSISGLNTDVYSLEDSFESEVQEQSTPLTKQYKFTLVSAQEIAARSKRIKGPKFRWHVDQKIDEWKSMQTPKRLNLTTRQVPVEKPPIKRPQLLSEVNHSPSLNQTPLVIGRVAVGIKKPSTLEKVFRCPFPECQRLYSTMNGLKGHATYAHS
jgi:hypothetical protein